VVAADAVRQHQRVPLAVHFVVEIDAVDFCECHAVCEVDAKATALVERKSISSITGTRTESASWKFRSGDGISASVDIEYVPGAVQREQAEAQTYSAAKLGFHRIYRYDQCIDVITGPQRSARLKQIDFHASGGVLPSLFDGNEQLISVTSVLWFARQVFLPVTSNT